jgi:class 3 adenylate cyclase
MPSVRRLTAILAADVAGYSRLMGADEEGTHERLKALRRARRSEDR